MALTALQVAAQVSRRARDANQTGTAQADVFKLLSRMQTIVNAGTHATIQSASLTVPPNTRLFTISGNLPNACRVVGVRDAFNRDLEAVDFDTLKWLDFGWFTEIGGDLYGWTTFGRDLLILRPGLTQQQTVTVFYQPIFAPLVNGADTFTIPDEDVPLVMDGVEALLDLKTRDYDNLKPILERWMKNVGVAAKELR